MPFHLYLEGDCPFDNSNWEEFLTLLSEERKFVNTFDLSLFTPRPSCRTSELAFARVGDLIFNEKLDDSCRLKIFESVGCGTGPDGLDFKGLGRLHIWEALCTSLASPKCQLKLLRVYDFETGRDHAVQQDGISLAGALADSLCRALSHNNSLIDLNIGFSVMTGEDCVRIVRCIEHHKTLSTISF